MRADLPRLRAHASRRAFTLMELLVVMGILAILMTLTVVAYQRVTATGRSTACLSNLRQLGAALNLYLGEHQMIMPELKAGRASREDDVPVLDNTLLKYVETPAVFLCPADDKYGPATGTSYSWNVALNGQPVSNLNFLGVLDTPSRVPILGDKEGFHRHLKDQVNILYGDGRVTQGLRLSTGS